LVKGKGLARLLVASNCQDLGVNFINTCLENQPTKLSDKGSQVIPPLEGCTWYKDIIFFLQEMRPPDGMNKNKVRDLNIKSIRYCLIDQYMYWKDPMGVILRCLDPQEAQRIMFDFHDSLRGGHHFWRTAAYKILRARYFWPSLFIDVSVKIRACVKCQNFSGKEQLKSFPWKHVVASGPFQQWGLDSIGEIDPTSSGQHMWILNTMDYFTKWIEAIPMRSASHKVIVGFLEDIMARFGCLRRIVMDNVASFKIEPLIRFCK
jgi:hypothetical protein